MAIRLFLAFAFSLSIFCTVSNGQDCAPPTIVANAKSNNLFSPEQEMIFGELSMKTFDLS